MKYIDDPITGAPVLILKAKLHKGVYRTEPCPFCGKRHIHGAVDGHRLAHCPHKKRRDVTAPDGTRLSPEDGYFLNRSLLRTTKAHLKTNKNNGIL